MRACTPPLATQPVLEEEEEDSWRGAPEVCVCVKRDLL